MKKTSLIIIVVLLCRLSNAQTWSALGHGLEGEGVFALDAYNNNIIAAGMLDSAGKISVNDYTAQWNGTSWDSIVSNLEGWQSLGDGWANVVWTLTVYHNNLYIGGTIQLVDWVQTNGVIEWNGKSWDTLGPGLGDYRYSPIYALAVYNDNLVAGGTFTNSGTNYSFNNIAMWNGKSWDTLGSGIGIPYNSDIVYALAEYNGNLYAGGTFTTAGGKPANNIAMWNGTSWSAVGGGTNGIVGSLMVYNGELYAGGVFDSAGGIPAHYIARWNGVSWSAVGNGVRYAVNGGGIGCFTLFNGDLVAGGNFDSAGGVYANNLAAWNDTSWSALTTKKMTRNSYIAALASYNGNLYVGGNFDSIGGIHANSIAEYCPGSCFVSNDTISTTSNFRVYPNPGNGVFTFQWSVVSGQSSVIEIYNVLGEKVYYATLKQVQGDNTIDLSSYANGMYFYRVTSGTGAKIGDGKLVKQ